MLCGNSIIYVKLLINCKHLSVGTRINTSGASGWCEYFNIPMCQTVGLWHTFTRPSLAALPRKLQPNLKPFPLAFVIRNGGNLFQIWERVWSIVRLDQIFTSEQRSQLPSYTYTLYCLAYTSYYYLILSAITDLTMHCTMWKYDYLCKTIDKL